MRHQRIRPGEVAIDLPATYDAGLYFIGRIHTPWARREDCPKNGADSDAVCTIEVGERYEAGLRDIESVSHLIVLYFMDEAPRDVMLQAPRHYRRPHGAFALRSPARPNPIACSIVRLVAVAGRRLDVTGLDCRDGTPLIDIKPYFASIDAVPEATVGWHLAEQGP